MTTKLHSIASYTLLALLYLGAAAMVGRLVFSRTLLDLSAPGQVPDVMLRSAVYGLTLAACLAGAAVVHAIMARK